MQIVVDGFLFKYSSNLLGLCDSELSQETLLEVIKDSVEVNVGYLDKVIIVLSGRIEDPHIQAIKQFLKWLNFDKLKSTGSFLFIYNKADLIRNIFL